MVWLTLNVYNLMVKWIVMTETSNRIEKDMDKGWRKREGDWKEKLISVWLSAKDSYFTCIWLAHQPWHHRFASWSERASCYRLPLCLGENHRNISTRKSLSLYIIRQITSAGPALSGYTQISHGLKMKSRSRPPLLLDVPTLPRGENDVL